MMDFEFCLGTDSWVRIVDMFVDIGPMGELGIRNVYNTSVMIIESVERFGLSQHHQLRGRVERGADQSYCILMTGHKLSLEAKTRLQTMVGTNDGFEIAEVDLRLRGPGNLMGTQQSGVLTLKIADIVKDNDILKTARYYATRRKILDLSILIIWSSGMPMCS